ncbi:orotidine-5'-phosphate decarboxylase [Pleomorphovibrio marinus]|uniref:orotidine-5'-phosphate decarboxylase n=1 Tax=Pleomorphovibrio marinus TaxID=2164132 RepID=UPI000E0A33A4|nr:orotidine-5'-phosphate decarboxylase [Pleomorphovibrio marinus]
MHRNELKQHILDKQSFLCVGLDPVMEKLPAHLHKESDPLFVFNKAIIDATIDNAVAYKPNLAFYEALGGQGWDSLQKTMEYLPKETFLIADAKRGDIGNTSSLYAKAFFERLNADAVTVAPYMGEDSVSPFLEFKDKWVILLALTSNHGSKDFQLIQGGNQKPLYEEVVQKSMAWGTPENLMFVVGATRGEDIARVRKIASDHFFLVPGVGAQGGNLEEVVRYGINPDVGLLVNSSRGIIFASSGSDFASAAKKAAENVKEEMVQLLDRYYKG